MNLGTGTTWYGLKSSRPNGFSDGKATALLQYGPKSVPDLPDVPTAYEITKDQKTLDVPAVISQLDTIGRPFFAPPNVPPDRVEELRRAFDAALADPELITEAERQSLPTSSMRGRAVQEAVEKISDPAPDLAALLQQIYKE